MSGISHSEFRELVFLTQTYLEAHGYPEIIDGPDTVKTAYKEFQRSGKYNGRSRRSLQESIKFAEELLEQSEGDYGSESYQTRIIDAQLASLERLEKDIPLDTLIRRLHGIDVHEMYDLAKTELEPARERICEILNCKPKNFARCIKAATDAELSLPYDEMVSTLTQYFERFKTKLLQIFSEEEVGVTELTFAEILGNGYNKPVAAGHSKVQVALSRDEKYVLRPKLSVIGHESFHTVGYGFQLRDGETNPYNSIILLNTPQTPFQEGIGNNEHNLHSTPEELVEELNHILPKGKKFGLQAATRLIKAPPELSRAFIFMKWYERFIVGVPKEELRQQVKKELGWPDYTFDRAMNFMDHWTSYYPNYFAADLRIVPVLKTALKKSPETYRERIIEFATQPDPSIFQ